MMHTQNAEPLAQIANDRASGGNGVTARKSYARIMDVYELPRFI